MTAQKANISIVVTRSAFLIALVLSAACSNTKPTLESTQAIIIPNGGFEGGALPPWLVYGKLDAKTSTNNVHSGKFSLDEESGAGSVYQDVTGLEVGATYEVSGFVSITPEATAPGQLAISDTAGTVAAFSPLLKGQQGWQAFSQSVRTIAPGTIRIQLYRYAGTGTIYWDDLQIRKE